MIPPRVLLIEDTPEQAMLMRAWLQRCCGVQVSIVHDVASARREIDRGGWQLVISDHHLPDAMGVELLRLSKEYHPHTPTLLISAHGSMEMAIDAIDGRTDGFMTKPFTRDTFTAKVSSLISEGLARHKPSRVVLAIGAHPDDVEVGCGGTLLKHRREGDQLVLFTLSRGAQGSAAQVREREATQAARKLGAQLILGDLEASRVDEGGETLTLIQRVIEQFQPSIIYTHSLHDQHQDHRAAHLATLTAAREIPALYCYQSPSTEVAFRPTRFVDITKHLAYKLDLLESYASQAESRVYLKPSLIQATAEYWGRFANYSLVEPLEVIRSFD